MRRRDALAIVLAATATLATGCGKSYVTTSLGRQHHVEPAVNRISERDPRRETPGEAGTQRDLARIARLLSAGEFAEVKRAAGAILKRHPGSVDAHTYMAVALERTGAPAAAGPHYLKAAQLAPANGGMTGNYGIWLCGQDEATEALAWLDRALASPGYEASPMLLANAGACAMKAGDPQRAERDLRRAIELDPENSVALGALARKAFRAGNAFEARAFSERRLAAAPADAKALLLASQIEQKLGDSAAAARYVSRLKAEFPDAQEARNSTMGDGGRQ